MVRPEFSFTYKGISFNELSPAVTDTDYGKLYTLSDGLNAELHITEYPEYDAVSWLIYLSNNGASDSGLITNLYDCNAFYPIDKSSGVNITYTTGNTQYDTEEHTAAEFITHTEILNGERRYAPVGGRSCDGMMPFFDVNNGGRGFIAAIGWTGQWNAAFAKESGKVSIRSGIEGVAFKLHSNERIRTSSILIMNYEGKQVDACNKFKRLIKEHFSLVGKEGRPNEVPLSFEGFGMNTDKNIEHIKKLREHNVMYGYYWIDASWYGKSKLPGYAEWQKQVGNWNIRTDEHPDRMQNIVDELEKSGSSLLVWFEPERAAEGTEWAVNHREWYYKPSGDQYLLNLGNDEARKGVFDMVSGYISELKIGCYRQDFNIEPLNFWRNADEPDRAGISEIKHIMGLYRFWDDLLAEHPNILIDNCSSGGRRIDIETLRRSVPIWRIDAYCERGRNPDIIQVQQFGVSRLLPYSGGVSKAMGDKYAARSCYASAYVGSWWWNGTINATDDDLDWMAKMCGEYTALQPYFSCDFYPLENTGFSSYGWSAWQYDRPESKDGIVMIFRRENSSCDHALYELNGVSVGSEYRFTDIDSGEETSAVNGRLDISMESKRLSKVIRYIHD